MEFVIIFILILFNGMFVAAEFAVVSAPRVTIEGLAQSGNKRARRVMEILKEPINQDRYIATSQVGITAASLGLGMYGEEVVAHYLHGMLEHVSFIEVLAIHGISSAIAIVLLTYFHIVLGEMVPKSLALQRSQAFLMWLIVPMSFCTKLFWPIILTLNGISNFLLKNILGVDRTQSSVAAFTPEEIEFIVKESETEGMLSDEIGNVIKELFDFGERIAEDVMVPRVHMVALPMRPEMEEVRRTLSSSIHTRYPVYEKDKDTIVGAVHIKDLGALLDREGVVTLPLRPVPFVPASSPIQSVLTAMNEFSTHIAIVIDEYGGTAGFITVRDVFEEVLGELDEGLQSAIKVLDDRSLRVAGTVRLDELAEHVEIDYEDEEVTTISGLVLDRLGRPPRPGDKVEFDALYIEVERIRGRGVHTCIIKYSESRKAEERE